MGLFDTLACRLPVAEGGFITEAQTKSLGCTMQHLVLGEDGRLRHANGSDTGFHGVIHFHGRLADGNWQAWEAKFTDGQLQHLLPGSQALFADEGLLRTSHCAANSPSAGTP